MGGLTLSSEIINRYFNYLKDLDIWAKKHLIAKLEESMKTQPSKKKELKDLFGAWEDNADSDEIVETIRSSRVEKTNSENLD